MSDDESPATGGQQENDADSDANNSIIYKVKSRVSSIFPQTLSKWFSPTTSTTTNDDNRNGNLRRRRDEQLDLNDKRHQQQNSDDSESDGGGSGSRSDVDLMLMPPSKKSRLNFNDDYPIMPPNRNLFASTPMVGGNGRRKNIELIKNTATPYNFTAGDTAAIIGSINARGIDEPHYIDEDGDVLEVVTDRRWTNNKNISSRRSLNIPTTSPFVPSQSSSTIVCHTNTKLYNLNETGEQNDNLDNENDDNGDADADIGDDDDEKINNEIRKAQKQYLTNGLRQSIRRDDISGIIGNNLNNSTGRISRSGGIGDSASESDESQCSSLIRQRNNIDKPKTGLFYPNLCTTTMTTTTNSQIGSKRTSSMMNGLNFYSHLEGKKSLFSEKNMNSILNNSTLSLTSLNRRQQFNASLYGSTSALSDSRLLNTISPFYKGRTTYGGASAYNKYAQLSLKQKQLHQRQIRVTPTLMRPTSSLSSSSNNSLIQENNNINQNINNNTNTTTAAISNTAKRILELMDQFTTPLNEVKKMANTIKLPLSSSPGNKKRFTEADLIASRGIRLSKPLTPYSRPISTLQQQSGQLPPPISELHVPSMAQLLQLKRLQNNNEKLREIANSSKSILNQREDYKLPNETNNNNDKNKINNSNNINDNIIIDGGKHINKMKNKINITRQSNKNQQQNEQQIPDINLPNVQLPFMKSVPKIDIKITPPATSSVSPQQQFSNSLNNKTSSTTNVNDKKSEITKYNISPRKPINRIELIDNTAKKLNGDIGEYIFSSPININNNNQLLGNKNINIESINNFKFSPPVAVDSTFLDCTNNNNLILDKNKSITTINQNNSEIISSSISSSKTNTVPQLKTGSVLDALKKSSPIISNNNSTPIISTTTLNTIGFGDKFKMPTNKWECSDCMVRNDETNTKCVACGTSKNTGTTEKSTIISSSAALNQIKTTTTNTFGDVFKPSSNTWECDSCMVRNKNDVLECIACSTKKPGSIKQLPSAMPAIPSTSAMKPLDIGFKNIVAQQTSSKWECTACMTRNDSNRTKCICCEQSKPGANNDVGTKFSFGAAAASVPATSQFKFGFGIDSGVPKENDLKNTNTKTSITTTITKKTDETDGFIFSGHNSAKDVAPSTKSLTGFTFGFNKTTNESSSTTTAAAVIPSNTVSGSTVSTGGFKFGGAQTTTSISNENKLLTQTKSTTENKIIDNQKAVSAVTTSNTVNLFNSSGFNVQSPSGLKFPENLPSSQKLSIENKNESNTPTSSAFKSVSGFTFGSTPAKASVNLNETKPQVQLFGATVTTTTTTAPPAEPLKGFIFGGAAAATATTTAVTKSTTVPPLVTRDEALKLFSSMIPPIYNEPAQKKTTPTIQKSTFPSSNFTFGDQSKNVATTNITTVPVPVTTAPSSSTIVFGSGGNNAGFVFGIPSTPATTATPLFGSSIVTPTGNVQSTTLNTIGQPTFGSIKPTVTGPAVSNQQQQKPSLFGSPSNINSSNSGSTQPTFGSGNNNNQTTIVPQTQTSSSIFGSNFSASNLKSPSSLETPSGSGGIVTATTTVPNQQSSNNAFSFGGATGKNEITTTTTVLPSFFSNTSTTTTSMAPNSGFLFGPPKPIESSAQQTNSIFGTGMTAPTNTNNNNNRAFGSTTFGSGSNNNNTNSGFGPSQPNINPFGNSSTNTQQQQQQQQQLQNTSSNFGTPAPVPTFGSPSGATFGSAPVQQQQSFGNSSNNPSLSFGGFGNNNNNRITGDSGDCSAAKKPADSGFNFGGAAPQTSNTGFQFGSNNNNNNNTKPAFNFSAQVQAPTPSFNFTGANEANSSQPFQFGAPSNTANIQMPLFNNYVGNESTPNTPFQFNAANNIFAPTPTPGTPSTQQGRRKIRTATRRMNPR